MQSLPRGEKLFGSPSIKERCLAQWHQCKSHCGICTTTDLTETRAFLSLMGHYRWFIKGFAQISQPLNEHLAGEGASRKSEWVSLSEEALEAFEALKQACMSSPVLASAAYTKGFLLETDASKEGLGAVLSQKQEDGWFHPVAWQPGTYHAWEELPFH